MSDDAGSPFPVSAGRFAPVKATLRTALSDPRFQPLRVPVAVCAALLAGGIVWHALLPPEPAFHGLGAFLMGPIPAAFGVPAGLYVHRRDPAWLRGLGAAAYGLLVCLAALLLLGPFTLGLWPTLRGVWGTLAVAVFHPLGGVAYLSDSHLALPALWSVLKVAMTWAALLYLALMTWRNDALAYLSPSLSRHRNNRAFVREQLRLKAEWQREYMECVRAGVPPPPPPPEIMVHGGVRTLGQSLQTLFWVGRIVLLIIGALGFWAALGEQVKALLAITARGVFGQLLFGGG